MFTRFAKDSENIFTRVTEINRRLFDSGNSNGFRFLTDWFLEIIIHAFLIITCQNQIVFTLKFMYGNLLPMRLLVFKIISCSYVKIIKYFK